MTATVRWTVVGHSADDSTAATSAARIMAWLDQRPDVELHTVLWESGYRSSKPYDFGRLRHVGKAHDHPLAKILRGVGQPRLAGGVAGRLVRSTLGPVPTDGVLYLSSARAGSVLKYLSPGPRAVITHLHASDRLEDPPLPQDRVESLVEATDVWLAVDEATRSWAVETWGLSADDVALVPEPIDLTDAPRHLRVVDPAALRLGLRGTTWFRRDHAPRIVQQLLAQRPQLDLELVWTDPVGRQHLGPLLHDLRQLGLEDRLEIPDDDDQVRAELAELDVLAYTTPDDDMGWLLAEAGGAGVPMVCWDSHQSATGVSAADGSVVPYLDLAAMATAILDHLDRRRRATDAELTARRDELHRRAMPAVGARLLDLAEGARR